MSKCVIYPRTFTPEAAIIAQLEELAPALLSDQLERTGALTGLLPVADPLVGRRVAGVAFTVKTRPGDNAVVHKALDVAEPGDFLIIDGGGLLDRAVIGELWCRYAIAKGVVAVALDGAARDIDVLRTLDLPIFARGITHLGPLKEGPGELRGPIAVGGTVVHCGDYVVGDADGVVVIPRKNVLNVIAAAIQRQDLENQMINDIDDGRLDRSWLDRTLQVEEIRATEELS